MFLASSGTVSCLNVKDGVCFRPVWWPTSDRIRPVALASAAAVSARSCSDP